MITNSEMSVLGRTPSPRTRASLAGDLRTLGLEAGTTLLVHASLGAIGWVVGGGPCVVQALLDALGPDGTLVMPAFSPEVSDPADWEDPRIPEAWLDEVRAHLPTFDPALTPTGMGRIAETFRTWPGVRRSDHPQDSFCALGRRAEAVLAHQPLAWSLGDDSPMGRMHELDARILLLGVGHERNSSLHFAEIRSPHRRVQTRRYPLQRGGAIVWRDVPDVGFDHGRFFPALGADFEKTGHLRVGLVGSAKSRLMSLRDLVDFAVPWFDRALSAPAGKDGVSSAESDA